MRPYPQSVVDRCKRLYEVHGSLRIVSEIVRIDHNVIQLMKSRGWKAGRGTPPVRQMPGDFPIQCNVMTYHELRAHYRTGLTCIRRWLAQVERDYRARPSASHQPIPTPFDLAETIAQLGVTKAAAHYGVHPNTLQRMRERAGLPVQRRKQKPRDLPVYAPETLRRAA